MQFPDDLRYTTDDEWLRVEGDEAVIGITDYAQDRLGDVVFIELPEIGRRLTKGDSFGVVESVKAVSDLFAPVSGEVIAGNLELANAPELVNQSPYEQGWMIRVRMDAPTEAEALLDAAAYQAQLPDTED